MPRTKLDELNHKYDKIISLIWGELACRDMALSDLARKTGISESRLRCRKKKPEDFDLGELTRIGRVLNIPIDELRGMYTVLKSVYTFRKRSEMTASFVQERYKCSSEYTIGCKK